MNALATPEYLPALKRVCAETPHLHVIVWPGAQVMTGRLTDAHQADRIARDLIADYPHLQVHVRRCTGTWCR